MQVVSMLLATAVEEYPPSWFVVAMGIGSVFVGLVCIILLCCVMSILLKRGDKQETPAVSAAPVAPAAPVETAIPNKQEFVAAVSAVLAEELGEDISAIRILSIKRV